MFDKTTSFRTVLARASDKDIGYMEEVDSKKSSGSKKTNYLQLCRGSKIVDISLFTDYMKRKFPHIYKPFKICFVVALTKKITFVNL